MMLFNKKNSILNNDKKYMIACFSIGFAMCCFGITRNLAELNWLSPLTILSCIIGIALTAVFVLMLIKGKCGFLDSYRAATVVIFILVISKWGIQILQDFVIKK
jgi:hypothetical protein